MVGHGYYGGRDLRLYSSLNTDHSNHGVIMVIYLHRLFNNCGERQGLYSI